MTLPSDTTIYRGLFTEVIKLGGYKSPVYQLRLDQSYAPYVRAIDWESCNRGVLVGNSQSLNRAYGTPTALIQVAEAWEAKEKAFGKNKGDQLWLDGFHPMDEWLCSGCGAVHSV
jgi:hypothetical protein